VLADYNVTPTEALGNRTPLSTLRDHLSSAEPTFLPRPLPPATVTQPDIGIVVETRTVRGNKETGKRPYICIDRVNYTNPLLANSMSLIKRELLVHIDEQNMQRVRAFWPTGEELGFLAASGGWGRTPHTREMRKLVNSLRDSGEFILQAGQDPIEAALAYYANRSYEDAQKRPHKVSKNATKVAHIAQVSGLPIPEAQKVNQPQPVAQSTERWPSKLVKTPVWKTIVK
jgi:hypothetical protein